VQSHVRLAHSQAHIRTIRIDCEEADLILGCDALVTASRTVLSMVQPNKTRLVINTAEVAPGEFVRDATYAIPTQDLKAAISARAGDNTPHFFDARALAVEVFGESMMANMIVLGYGYQLGHIPLTAQAIEKALHLNGQDVDLNIQAFRLGRQLVFNASLRSSSDTSLTLDALIGRRIEELTHYQDESYGKRYGQFVRHVRARETEIMGENAEDLTRSVIHNLFKLMAIKDEYEVARLYTDGRFQAYLNSVFEGKPKNLRFHLAPPVLSFIKDPRTGRPRKWSIPGGVVWPLFRVLAHMKFLRGTLFDPFCYLKERQLERQLLSVYEQTVRDIILPGLSADTYKDGLDYANLPEKIRGFGPIKEASMVHAEQEARKILERFSRNGDSSLAHVQAA
jgi:indolepyruvate ferredoxin oxidoreductase